MFIIFPQNQILPSQISYVVIVIVTLTWELAGHRHFHSLFLKLFTTVEVHLSSLSATSLLCASFFFTRPRRGGVGRISGFRISGIHCLSLFFPSLIFLGSRIFLYSHPGESRKKCKAIYAMTEMYSHIHSNSAWSFDSLFFYL